jgi:alanine racemase
MNNHITVLEIDGNALKHNLQYFKNKLENDTKVLVVVKAFGYGSEASEIAKYLENDVDYFAVAYTDEGIALRNSGVTKPILVLHPQIPNLELIIHLF